MDPTIPEAAVSPRMAFCSACDRPVPVAIKAGARPHERPALQDAEDVVCLDYQVRCTGAFCPTFSLTDDTLSDPDVTHGVERMR